MMLITLCHQFDLLPPITLLLLIDLLGQVHQLGQQVLSLHQLSQGKPLNQWAHFLSFSRKLVLAFVQLIRSIDRRSPLIDIKNR